MMNKKTLISFIGRGRIDKNHPERYLKAAYNFGENVICESRCFAEAIRKCDKFTFDRAIFIGSETSSWSVLLESMEDVEFDLWSELYDHETCEKTISPENKNKLQQIMQELWGVPVELAVYPPELLPENSSDILNRYIDSLLSCGNDILLDITHGFRWMPVLLTSLLQFRSAYSSDGSSGKVEIIYGELNTGNGISPVRQLDILVQGQENANAIALFFQKFEAEPLAEKLSVHWQSGAKAIRKLGLHIQGNYFLPLLFDLPADDFPIGKPLAQLKNALKDFDPDSSPGWIRRIYDDLTKLYSQLSVDDPVQRLLNLSQLLAEKQCYGQAVCAVCLAAEQSLLIAFDQKKHPGYECIKELKEKFKKHASQQYKDFFYRHISGLRNQVAHGGAPDLYRMTVPQPEALKSQYEKILRMQKEFQQYLQTEFSSF